tara:strand:- start:11942 stop:12664 length:723 start_codon:yes stop_codon:yes gene_type:complete
MINNESSELISTYIAAPFGNYIHTNNTKSVRGSFTLYKRKGLIKQILKTLRYSNGSWYNSIGLRNPGIEFGLKKYRKNKKEILSLAAIESDDWSILSEVVPDDVDVELNLSCPNIKHFENYTQGIEKFLTNQRKVIVKISPTFEQKEIEKLINTGFTSIHCCNTFLTDKGGQSGKILYPYVIKIIDILKSLNISNLEIIAGGGIENKTDIKRYLDHGANGISLGTVCFNPYKLYKILMER